MRWGGDAEGGAPFVEADPSDPSKLRGFDVEVAEQIAKGLGRRAEFIQVSFSDIDQSVQRGDFEIGMSGVEDTPARRRMFAATIPYFEFHEVLTVRIEDQLNHGYALPVASEEVVAGAGERNWNLFVVGVHFIF